MEPTKSEQPKETKYEIEQLAEANEARREAGVEEISFDNAGNMVVNNRARRRNLKQLWRSVREGQKSIRHYTKPKAKTDRRTKKQERQNRKKGRK